MRLVPGDRPSEAISMTEGSAEGLRAGEIVRSVTRRSNAGKAVNAIRSDADDPAETSPIRGGVYEAIVCTRTRDRPSGLQCSNQRTKDAQTHPRLFEVPDEAWQKSKKKIEDRAKAEASQERGQTRAKQIQEATPIRNSSCPRVADKRK